MASGGGTEESLRTLWDSDPYQVGCSLDGPIILQHPGPFLPTVIPPGKGQKITAIWAEEQRQFDGCGVLLGGRARRLNPPRGPRARRAVRPFPVPSARPGGREINGPQSGPLPYYL